MSSHPRVGVGVIIKLENKYLLGKRINSHGENSWSFPGGHLEQFESWEECAKRETLEETGLHIENIQFLTATNDIFPAEQKHYITIFMTAQFESGELSLKEPEKCECWQWFEPSDFPEELFIPIQNLLKKEKL